MQQPSVHCDYFAAGDCRSCTLIETPYDSQLAAQQLRCQELLPQLEPAAWLQAVPGGVRDFRNKAKLVVGGSPNNVTLGILDREQRGVDLRHCLIQSAGIRRSIPILARFIESIGVAPYDVRKRRGELKFVHVTEAPASQRASAHGEDGLSRTHPAKLMLRFVVRSEEGAALVRQHLAQLRTAIPHAAVITVNFLPEHKAVLEGSTEECLFGHTLPMQVNQVTLNLLPQSFFQTNSNVAARLYKQASDWVDRCSLLSVWDLYCGVGGFALSCADDTRDMLGVELSEAAVQSAKISARDSGARATFTAQDATEFALAADVRHLPDLVIVNPPRRGVGDELATWLNRATPVRHVIYSSCNPVTLAKDLSLMPRLRPIAGRVFDMFPHTSHLEVAVLLERASLRCPRVTRATQ